MQINPLNLTGALAPVNPLPVPPPVAASASAAASASVDGVQLSGAAPVARFNEGTEADRTGLAAYAQARYGNDAEAIDSLRSKASWGMHIGIRLAEAAAAPLGDESQTERLRALTKITTLHRKASAWSGEWAHADIALDHYARVKASAQPGESFGQLMGDYIAVLTPLAERNRDTRPAIDSFLEMRRETADREILQALVAGMGQVDEARATLAHFDALPAGPEREVRQAFGLEMAERTGRFKDAVTLYEAVDRLSASEGFEPAAALMRRLVDIAPRATYTVAPTFEHVATLDAAGRERFLGLVEGLRAARPDLSESHLNDATRVFAHLQGPQEIPAFLCLAHELQTWPALAALSELRLGSRNLAGDAMLYLQGRRLVEECAGRDDPMELGSMVMANVVKERGRWSPALQAFPRIVGMMHDGNRALEAVRTIGGADDPGKASVALDTLLEARVNRSPWEAVQDLRVALSSRAAHEDVTGAAERLARFIPFAESGEEARSAHQFATRMFEEGRPPVRFERLFQACGQTSTARAGVDLVEDIGDGSTVEAREASLVRLMELEKGKGQPARDALQSFPVVVEDRLEDESLTDATERMARLMGACVDSKAACEAFRFLMDGARADRFAPLSVDDASDQLVAALEKNHTLEKAKEWVMVTAGAMNGAPRSHGNVSQDEEWVTIGTVKVRKNRA